MTHAIVARGNVNEIVGHGGVEFDADYRGPKSLGVPKIVEHSIVGAVNINAHKVECIREILSLQDAR